MCSRMGLAFGVLGTLAILLGLLGVDETGLIPVVAGAAAGGKVMAYALSHAGAARTGIGRSLW